LLPSRLCRSGMNAWSSKVELRNSMSSMGLAHSLGADGYSSVPGRLVWKRRWPAALHVSVRTGRPRERADGPWTVRLAGRCHPSHAGVARE
jgi:hypothetical protein